MREVILDRLFAEFGDPVHETPSRCSWSLGRGVDLIAQKNSPARECAVWVPCLGAERFPGFCECFDDRWIRPADSYDDVCPALAQGKRVCRLSVREQRHLELLVAELRCRIHDPAP